MIWLLSNPFAFISSFISFLALAKYDKYTFCCSSCISLYNTLIVLSGSSVNTSFFILLNTKGSIIFFNFSRLGSFSSFTIGVSNISLNFLYLNKYPGIIKSNIDHSSDSEFSIGVPVSANLVLVSIFFIALAFCVLLFLTYWASSAIIYLKLNAFSSYISMSLFSES